MRTAEAAPATVLHRLIQEQLRFGKLADTRALLAIQQQALRGGGRAGVGGGDGGTSAGSPLSSLESLAQEESPYMHVSTRQDPQGQEYQGSSVQQEKPLRNSMQLHGEELPTYEEAKYLMSQKGDTMSGCAERGQWDAKREHARSLSERLMQLSLERSTQENIWALSSSLSFPQLYSTANVPEGPPLDPRGPPPEYPLCPSKLPQEVCFQEPPPPFHPQHRNAHNPMTVAPSDVLMRENQRLRQEVEMYAEKAARFNKLEKEIERISEAYETLMKGSAKREALEKTMRNKLEAEMKRMHDFNRDLREQLCSATKHRAAMEAECSDRKQHVFLKLLEQNEEQQREKERLERNIQHLRLSAEESQRARELLEKALLSSHARNRQLEEELQRKRAYVEKVERLQSSLAQLQAACEKREALELRLRTRLEQELKSMRTQQNQTSGAVASVASSSLSQQQLREREERILALEADITKWEQKYLEESTMRQFAMDAAATAAAQRDTTIINNSPGHSPDSSFNEDLPPSSPRHQEMENRIRALHVQLLEKDAVIRVLQQRSRWEQSKLEKQGLRLARSVPSISTASGSIETKAKSLSDDQTSGAVLRRRDSSTQCDEAPLRTAATDTSEEPDLGGVKSINRTDADMVEILI
ncbi:angiomotin-like 2a isoform X2 [Dunckerocampus dactyliophorus]|uniref:angiomotin-like 2a isoform X2 n=1 Tax=Dunckerocampus dactyliophorus TaxID=161453 RepID=UPI0024060BA4|nr:angiomotin-like 2a isoform X2 [Dunckerocampus dactyliophorus]